MLNQHSLGEIAEIHNLLGDIKKEYEIKNKPENHKFIGKYSMLNESVKRKFIKNT